VDETGAFWRDAHCGGGTRTGLLPLPPPVSSPLTVGGNVCGVLNWFSSLFDGRARFSRCWRAVCCCSAARAFLALLRTGMVETRVLHQSQFSTQPWLGLGHFAAFAFCSLPFYLPLSACYTSTLTPVPPYTYIGQSIPAHLLGGDFYCTEGLLHSTHTALILPHHHPTPTYLPTASLSPCVWVHKA